MTDSTHFEQRLTEALGRLAERVPVDVDPDGLVAALASTSATVRSRRHGIERFRLVLAIVVVVAATLAGLALFGGRLQAPVPPVVVSPSPSGPTATPSPTATTSPSPAVTASPVPTPVAVLHWTAEDIGAQPGITGIWRVGEWFIAVGPDSGFADDDEQVDARFLRSRDGHAWENVPAPARGLEVETGTVDDGVLWVVGKLGTSAAPKRGIWTTSDGETWQRVADVTGLDFGPGRVDQITHARNGWLALARRWIDPEAQDGFMLHSTDGVAWTRQPYPDVEGLSGIAGLVSDGDRWLMATTRSVEGGPNTVQALISDDAVTWTPHVVATLEQGGPARVTSGTDGVAWGPRGFVIVGTRHEGEFPHPLAWHSSDGETWTSARTDALPGLAGESGIQVVTAFDDGYLGSGHRLQDAASFWTSQDGTVWTQVDDLSGGPLSRVSALAVSNDALVAGGEDDDGPFIWSAPRP